jgi:hypothetical protein
VRVARIRYAARSWENVELAVGRTALNEAGALGCLVAVHELYPQSFRRGVYHEGVVSRKTVECIPSRLFEQMSTRHLDGCFRGGKRL